MGTTSVALVGIAVACAATACGGGGSSSSASGSAKASSSAASGPGPSEFADHNQGADLLKVPSKAGEACPNPGTRILSKTKAIVCHEGQKSYEIECKGAKGIAPSDLLASCDITGNAAGDNCYLMIADTACVGNKLYSCDVDLGKAGAPGKVKIETCTGPKGCFKEGTGDDANVSCDGPSDGSGSPASSSSAGK